MIPMTRVLPADVFDTLELSALAFGGIGQPELFKAREEDCPNCIYGHAQSAANSKDLFDSTNPVEVALDGLGCMATSSDNAVARINARRNLPPESRVSFADWCAELGVIRGES